VIEAVVITAILVVLASIVGTYVVMISKVQEADRRGYEKGFAEGVESQRRWNAHREPEKRLIKVDIPNFGAPKLKIYSPIDYMAPLVCTAPSCGETLVAGDDFYEIPIVGEPGTYAAVHLRCERKEMYGNPPHNQADERLSREASGDDAGGRPRRWFRKSVQGSDGRAQ
jgi:hypothetical protein